jgi:4-hydroxybenzoate polyprenyltransferase
MTTRAYLELLRPANVATALADVLAGFAIAGLRNQQTLPLLLFSTACLYAGGVVLNDVFDRQLDAVERPERPIPSGRARVPVAATLGAALLACGVLAAALASRDSGLMAAAIAALVVLYDAWTKRHPLLGPVNMGLCRALNLLLGVTAVPDGLPGAWPLAGIPLVYIGAVTGLSRGEVAGSGPGRAVVALLSLSVALLALILVTLTVGGGSLAGVALVLVLGWRVLPPFWKAYRQPEPAPIRRAVRAGVLSLVLVNAAIAATYGGFTYSLVILATAVLAEWLARVFPVT